MKPYRVRTGPQKVYFYDLDRALELQIGYAYESPQPALVQVRGVDNGWHTVSEATWVPAANEIRIVEHMQGTRSLAYR